MLLFVGSSLGLGTKLQYLCSPQSVSSYSVLKVWRNVLSGRKLPADVGEVLEGEGGTVRPGWRLLGQAADDCFLTGERETELPWDRPHSTGEGAIFPISRASWLSRFPPHLFLHSFILPYCRMTAERHADAV